MVAIGIKFVDQMGRDLDLATVKVELPTFNRIIVDDRWFGLVRAIFWFLFRGYRLFPSGFAFVVNGFLDFDDRVAIEVWIRKEAGCRPGVVEDIEEELAVFITNPGAPADDLLELRHGVDNTDENNILHGRSVHTGRQHLRTGKDDRSLSLDVLETTEVPTSDVAFITGHPTDEVGMLLHEVRIEIVQRLPHLVGVLLVNTEHDGLGVLVRLAEELGKVFGHRLSSCPQSNGPLEIVGLVFFVRNLTAESVNVAFAGSPTRSIPGGDDPMDTIWSQEAIVDALAKAVLVDRIAKIPLGDGVVVSPWCGGHPDLMGWLEVLQNLTPPAVVVSAAAVTLIHDD